jgi:hypothetical protein
MSRVTSPPSSSLTPTFQSKNQQQQQQTSSSSLPQISKLELFLRLGLISLEFSIMIIGATFAVLSWYYSSTLVNILQNCLLTPGVCLGYEKIIQQEFQPIKETLIPQLQSEVALLKLYLRYILCFREEDNTTLPPEMVLLCNSR